MKKKFKEDFSEDIPLPLKFYYGEISKNEIKEDEVNDEILEEDSLFTMKNNFYKTNEFILMENFRPISKFIIKQNYNEFIK